MYMDPTIVLTLDDWHDGALLNSRRSLETVGIDTAKKLGFQIHRIKGVCGLIVVGLDLACSMNGLVEVGNLSSSLCPLQVGRWWK